MTLYITAIQAGFLTSQILIDHFLDGASVDWCRHFFQFASFSHTQVASNLLLIFLLGE
jgi:hypothetical protein